MESVTQNLLCNTFAPKIRLRATIDIAKLVILVAKNAALTVNSTISPSCRQCIFVGA